MATAARAAATLQSLKSALVHDSGAEEQVQVNQRALIDKLLARYSSEFTVFRELLQNSNDAGATAAQIVFRRDPSLAKSSFLPWTRSADVASVSYRNNGRPMSEQDFARLRSIAEGNPDVQKIGFFGVGFYSLFSICEEPFVTSGNQTMAFVWKGDALYTKRGTLPEDALSEWTTFFLDLREPIEVPKTAEFGRFIATSLAFTTSLKSVEVFVDDERVLFFNKKGGGTNASAQQSGKFDMPDRRLYALASPNNVFRISSIHVAKIQMDVEAKSRRGGSDPDRYTLFMRIGTGDLAVSVPRKVADDMLRTTKKGTPSTTPLRIMFSNFDEYEGSVDARTNGSNMFDDLIPGPTDQGRIFIGFPTHQTTGCAIQLAAHLIPTVERENIDFVDRTLQYWNTELLTLGGVVARVFCEHELDAIQRLYDELGTSTDARDYLEKKAIHIMNVFTFKPSTPSSLVGRLLSEGFYNLCKTPIRVVSSRGVLPASDVRLPVDDIMAVFIRVTPILSRAAVDQASELIKRLRQAEILKPIGFSDVAAEMDNRAFTVDETVALFKWWLRDLVGLDLSTLRIQIGQIQRRLVVQDAADVINNKTNSGNRSDTNSKQETAIRVPMSRITHFVMPQLLPPDLPMPETVMPYCISRHFSKSDLETAFWGLQELRMTEWVAFVTKQHPDFCQSPDFTERVLAAVCRAMGNLSVSARESVLGMLSPTRCIITQRGFMLPTESYMPSVTLFPDLPKVAFQNPKSVTEPFLKSLGVREHVDLQMVFDRLNSLNWDQGQLIKYLASVQTKLTQLETNRLRVSFLFLRETVDADGGDAKTSSDKPDDKSAAQKRYRASDLYEPNDVLRKFGLPLMAWTGTRWRANTDEARLMLRLGLRQHVPVAELVSFASAASTPAARMEWIKHFLDRYDEVYKGIYTPDGIATPFLPTASDPNRLALPTECFVDSNAAVMGFSVLDPSLKSYADKLGVARTPSPSVLLDRLRTDPPSLETAANVFVFLGTCQSSFSQNDWSSLRNLKFIPVKRTMNVKGAAADTQSSVVVHMAPTMVYLDQYNDGSALQSHFTYVDFGMSANAFLRACGVKDQPSPLELATNLVKNPQDFLDASGLDEYLSLLRQIAANFETLKRNSSLLSMMKASPFLIGSRTTDDDNDTIDSSASGSMATLTSTSKTQQESTSSDSSKVKYRLAKASEIYLIDDTVLAQIFRPLSAPIDEMLEPMYHYLGSKWIMENVQESYAFQGNVSTTPVSSHLQSIINERAPLLLYDGHQMRPTRELKAGAESILSTLRVYNVPHIDIVRKFNGVTKTQRTTACMAQDSKTRAPTLLVTSNDHDSFDVATAVARTVLRQPRLNDFLLMSTLLSTSLENLNRKGFPVDRILNLRASKNKGVTASPNAVVERRKSLEKKESSADEASDASKKDIQTLTNMFPDADPAYLQKMVSSRGPGRLQEIANDLTDHGYKKRESGSSSDPPPSLQTQDSKSSRDFEDEDGFLSMIDKFTGLGIKNSFGGGGGIGSMASRWTKSIAGAISPTGSSQPNQPPPEPSISPNQTATLRNHLKNSIASARVGEGSGFRSTIPLGDVPSISKALRNECHARSEQDLVLATKIDGMSVYMDRSVEEQGRALLASTPDAAARFVRLLKFISDVFSLPHGAVHVYWDKDGSTIAFNRGRALFMNLRFYVGLHYVPVAVSASNMATPSSVPGSFPTSSVSNPHGSTTNAPSQPLPPISAESAAAVYYWFLTMCHELAHNFVAEHDSTHEHWMSSFAETYMGPLVAAMIQARMDVRS